MNQSDNKKVYGAPELVLVGELQDIVKMDTGKFPDGGGFGADMQADPLS